LKLDDHLKEFPNVENYIKKNNYRGNPITTYHDKEGRLHRIDGPAYCTSFENKFYIHGEEFQNYLLFKEKLEELEENAVLNKTLDKLDL